MLGSFIKFGCSMILDGYLRIVATSKADEKLDLAGLGQICQFPKMLECVSNVASSTFVECVRVAN